MRRSTRCAFAETSMSRAGRPGASSTWSASFSAIGATKTRLKVVKRIVRCAATNVDPDTGIRDLDVPQALMRALGHGDCGVYAEVVSAGEIATGDAIAGPDEDE